MYWLHTYDIYTTNPFQQVTEWEVMNGVSRPSLLSHWLWHCDIQCNYNEHCTRHAFGQLPWYQWIHLMRVSGLFH
jgi:hypothetical protein